MQDIKIEYRDGKLVELSIDDVSFKTVTAIAFNHEVGETLPTVSLTLPIGVVERLVQTSPIPGNLRIIEK